MQASPSQPSRLCTRRQVSLQRLQNFLLEDETQREKYYTLCGRGEDRNVTPRVVINDAAFAPIGGDEDQADITPDGV